MCIRARSVLSLLLVAALVGEADRSYAADPLGKVTGTEQWHQAPVEDPAVEWDEWLVARRRWREALRELQVQRKRSAQLARFLRFRPKRRSRTGRGAPKSGGVAAPLESVDSGGAKRQRERVSNAKPRESKQTRPEMEAPRLEPARKQRRPSRVEDEGGVITIE